MVGGAGGGGGMGHSGFEGRRGRKGMYGSMSSLPSVSSIGSRHIYKVGACSLRMMIAIQVLIHSGASYLSQDFVMFFHVSCEGLPEQ